MLYLGIDHGPWIIRAVVFSLESNGVVAEATQPSPAEAGEGIVADPFVWARAIDECVQECLGKLGSSRSRLAGMAMAGHPGGLALLGRDHRVVAPARRPEDQELADAAKALRRRFGGTPGVVEMLGRPLADMEAAVHLSWLARSEPQLLAGVVLVQRAADFVQGWLTGTTVAEVSSAAESGLLDVRARAWSEDMLREIDAGLGDRLAPVRRSGDSAGGLRREIARRWGVPDHLLVAGGGSRTAMALLGTGSCNPGEVLINFAEQGGLQLVLARPATDPTGKLALQCDACDQWYFSLDHSGSVRLAEEVMEQSGWDRGQFEHVAGLVEPGAGGLVFQGGPEGGTLAGIGGGNLTSPNLARAATEAVTLELGRALDRMRELGGKPARAKIIGTAGTGEGRRKMLADVLGIPVGAAHPVSSSAVGAALQAAVAFYEASGENLSFTEIAEYALPVPEDQWAHPGDEGTTPCENLAERQAKLESSAEGGLN